MNLPDEIPRGHDAGGQSFDAGVDREDFRLGLALGLLARDGASVDEVAAAVGVSPDAVRASAQDLCTPPQGSTVKLYSSNDPTPMLSVVLPVLDEEPNLGALMDLLVPVVEELGSYEIIVVDDGSSDASTSLVLDRRSGNSSIKLVELSRNFGHQAALTAGIDHAAGDAVVLMDADLQDPPVVLQELVARWRAGAQVVYAVRRNRKEGPVRRVCYFAFYRLMRKIANITVPVDSGDFCLMDRAVVDVIASLPERSRYLRGLRAWVGFRQDGVEYERSARHAGQPKYTVRALVRLAFDGLLAFSSVPLRIASYFGSVVAGGGILYLLVAVYARVVNGSVPRGWTSVVLIQLVLGGAQLLVLGVVGEYLARTYEEAKRRPVYVVLRRHGFESSDLLPNPSDAWPRRRLGNEGDG